MTDEISAQNAIDNMLDALHQWFSQLRWYPGCQVTDVSGADDGYIICRISGGTNQQCSWKKLFSIAVGDYVDVLYDPASMRWEVFKPGGSVSWSTSYWNIDHDCIRMEYTNNATGTLSLGEVVVFDSTQDYSVTTTNSEGDIDVAGVVLIGAAAGATVQVAVLGQAAVYVDGNVTRGQFLKTSSARGFATPTSTFDQGVFGVALTANTAGSSGTVDAFLVGHCWEGAGGSGGNTLDEAYDEGGAGAGRTITADSGAVVIQNAGGAPPGARTQLLKVDGDIYFDGNLEAQGNLEPHFSCSLNTQGWEIWGGSAGGNGAYGFFAGDQRGAFPGEIILRFGSTNFDIAQRKLAIQEDSNAGGTNTVAEFQPLRLQFTQNYILDMSGGADAIELDSDGDTTISAPTDDRIDVECSGVDVVRILGATGDDTNPWRLGGTVLGLDFTGTAYNSVAKCNAVGLRFNDNDTPYPTTLAVGHTNGSWSHVAATGWQPAATTDAQGPSILVPLMRPGNWQLEITLTYNPAAAADKMILYMGYVSSQNDWGAYARYFDSNAGASEIDSDIVTNDGDDTGTAQISGAALAGTGDRTLGFRIKNATSDYYDPQAAVWSNYQGRQNPGIAYTAAYAFIQVAKQAGATLSRMYIKDLTLTYLL